MGCSGLWCVLLGARLDAMWCGWGRMMRPTDCEVCAEGRAAMDAGTELGPEGAASLAPALEKMTQLTLLALYGARIRFWARSRGVGGVFCFGACC